MPATSETALPKPAAVKQHIVSFKLYSYLNLNLKDLTSHCRNRKEEANVTLNHIALDKIKTKMN